MHYAPDCTAEEVMDVLQQHAMLVQGLWAPRNSLVFTGNEHGSHRVARDYVLLLFSKKPVISSSSLHYPPSLKNAVNQFLKIFAVERPKVKDWKFKEHTDSSFIKIYPHIVKEQEQKWGELERRLMDHIGDGKSGRGVKSASMSSRPVKSLPSEIAAVRGATEVVSGTNIPDDIREALSSKVLPKVIQDHKVCRYLSMAINFCFPPGFNCMILSNMNTDIIVRSSHSSATFSGSIVSAPVGLYKGPTHSCYTVKLFILV